MPKGIPRDKSVERTFLHRLKIARGHLDRVIAMVENGDYCIDVIHQSQAVQSALKNADQAMLKNHLETCVPHAVHNGNAKEVIDEVMKIMEKN